ncbi:MAG: alpha/beta fold hydrolase [Gammaproteobacteria bacterium]|nr:alpha/beta fold hydrolase [Gammaproteobacteria bacterium]
MPAVFSNGIELAYETHGDPANPVLLMVQGLGMPLSAWPKPLLDALVDAGFHLITFDNRDIGKSTLMHDRPPPNMLVQTIRRLVRMKVKAPYQLTDMMRDLVGLMDALDIKTAHVVGVSMGGMIAQLLAIHAPQRVDSLTLIMSTTNERNLPGPTHEVSRFIMRGPQAPTDKARLAFQWQLWRMLGSPAYPLSDQELTGFLQMVYSRGVTAAGTARHTLAILAAPGRAAELRRVAAPTLVIHGDSDPLVPIECGRAIAEAIPGAHMETIKGMGHDLPLQLIPRLTQLISEHVGDS